MKSASRISYLDVAKGLLILSVLIHHIPYTAEKAGVNLHEYFQIYRLLIVPFFMPAFFVITGWCTNFDKGFKTFLWSNVKGLLIPAFVLGALSNWIVLIADRCVDPVEYAKLGFRTIVTNGGPYWFISALFVAKVLYWLINRYSPHKIATWSVMLACLCVGLIVYNRGGGWNYWNYQHAFILLIFLHMGRKAKNMKLSWTYLMVYAVLVLISQLSGWHPSITQGIHIRVIEIPLFLALAFTGSMSVLWISKCINSDHALECWGQQSIILYGLHVSIFISLFKEMARYDLPFNILSVSAVTIITTGLCTFGAYILNFKYIRCLIGRF